MTDGSILFIYLFIIINLYDNLYSPSHGSRKIIIIIIIIIIITTRKTRETKIIKGKNLIWLLLLSEFYSVIIVM